MNKTKEYVRKSLVVFLGMIFMGLGINFIVYANIGADPFTTGVMGIFAAINRFGDYSFGTAQVIMNIVFISIAFFLNKKKIGFGTVISAFTIGITVDLWKRILFAYLPLDPSFAQSIFLLVLGALIVSTGIAIYVSPDFGLGAGEIIPMIISEKTGWKFKYLKIANDLIFFMAGVAMGAVYGIGTIISLSFMGPTIHFLIPHMKKIFAFNQQNQEINE